MLIGLENESNYDYRFSQHLLKFSTRIVYSKIFINRLLVYITTKNNIFVIHKIKKYKNVIFW